MSAQPTPTPVLFTFPESVFARRIERYLNLRSLPYLPILVPPRMPRPLLASLGIKHRRIPLLALGRDIYIDTRLILRKLEVLFPDSADHPTLGAKNGFGRGFEEMLEGWVIDAGPFWRTSGCIPTQAPLVRDDAWMEDRFDGSGGAFTRKALKEGRPWCISQLRVFFGVVENMLSDGRKWLLGGETPGLAEIHGAWVYDWAINMGPDMKLDERETEEAVGDLIRELGASEFPETHGWVKRFREDCERAREVNGGAGVLREGEQAEAEVVRTILEGTFVEGKELSFDMDDVLGLKKGQRVSIAPTDFGFTHPDEGILVGLTRNEYVIEVEVPGNRGLLRLHFPRIDFKVKLA